MAGPNAGKPAPVDPTIKTVMAGLYYHTPSDGNYVAVNNPVGDKSATQDYLDSMGNVYRNFNNQYYKVGSVQSDIKNSTNAALAQTKFGHTITPNEKYAIDGYHPLQYDANMPAGFYDANPDLKAQWDKENAYRAQFGLPPISWDKDMAVSTANAQVVKSTAETNAVQRQLRGGGVQGTDVTSGTLGGAGAATTKPTLLGG